MLFAIRQAVALVRRRRLATLRTLPPPNVRKRTLLRLEALEDRCVPADFTVTTLNDFGDGSLRTAIANADGGPNASYTIDFEQGLSGTINLGGQLPALGKNITITGPGADSIVINGASSYLIFDIANGKTCVISGLVLSQGAPAINNTGVLTLNNCQINNCSATFGGGIANNGQFSPAVLTLNNTSFYNDTAQQLGGGIYNYGGQVNFNSGSITHCSAFLGGGIYTDSDGSNNFLSVGDGVTIGYNYATQDGGGIYAAKGAQDTGRAMTMGNSALIWNTAGRDGGGVFVAGGSATFTGTGIQNNKATNEGGGFFLSSTGALTLNVVTGGGNTAATGPGGACEDGCSYENDGSFTDQVVIVVGP